MSEELNPHLRLLLGPGPSPVHPRILKAMSTHVVGHLDPDFLSVMDDCQVMLRDLFNTENQVTFPVSGTGSAAMEASVCNIIEPGDKAVICVNGVFGGRMSDVAARYGADVVTVEAPWGQPIDPQDVKAALDANPDAVMVGLVHAETSTGVLQPMEEIGAMCREHGALLLLDCVTSLGGVPVELDKWGVEVAYSGTQKCLACPPGVAPITFSERALGKVRERKSKVTSWYFDVSMVEKYWGNERVYHHTGPISMNYAIREALRIIFDEGLEARFARHALASKALQAGVEALEAGSGHRHQERSLVREVAIRGGARHAEAAADLPHPHTLSTQNGDLFPFPKRQITARHRLQRDRRHPTSLAEPPRPHRWGHPHLGSRVLTRQTPGDLFPEPDPILTPRLRRTTRRPHPTPHRHNRLVPLHNTHHQPPSSPSVATTP